MAERSLTSETREIPPLDFRATVAPATLDEEKRTVEVTWTTGARVLRGFWDRFYEELDLSPKSVRMGRLKSGDAPLLNTHNSYDLNDVIGVVESARLEGDKGAATIRFARDPASDAIFAKVKDGILRNISVGYRVYRYDSVEDVGDGSIPVKRATDWEPYELSVVPLPADAGATVRSDSAATNPCEFIVEEKKMKPNPKSEPQAGAEPTTRTPDELLAEDRERGAEILRTARTLGVDPKLAEEHAHKGTSATDFYRIAVKDHAERTIIKTGAGGDPARITAGEDACEKFARGAGDWLIERAGKSGDVIEAAKKRGEIIKVDPGEYRGARLLDLARESLDLRGVRWKGKSPTETFALALSQRSAYGAAATGDFPILLENVLHKTLLAAYVLAPDTWRMFSKVGIANDFRPHNRYRKGSFGRLDTVPEGAEVPHKSIPDGEKESITVETKANIIAVTRQMLVNDDLGAFTDLASDFGMAAGLSIEEEVYELLLENGGLGPDMSDGNPLFDASHANLGTGAAISAASIFADKVIMGRQKDPSGHRYLGLRPTILLVPDGLEGVAKQLVQSPYDPDVSNKFQLQNIASGIVSTIIGTPRLSGTRRYMLADPSMAPTIEVDFLDGQQQPRMETRQGWEIEGAEWKIVLDFKANAIDFRGAVTNAGV